MAQNMRFILQEANTDVLASQETVERNGTAFIEAARLATAVELLDGLAHQINNPLAVIQGKALLLIKRLKAQAQDPDAILQDLEKIIATSNRISRTLAAIRSFSRHEDSAPFMPASLQRIIENAIELCRERFHYLGVALQVDVVPDIFVECRSAQITQAIFYILDHAKDAARKAPNAVRVDLRVNQESEHIVLEITPRRIAPSEVADVPLLPFESTKGDSPAVGLGLAIALEIAKEHGGDLQQRATGPHPCFELMLPKSRIRHRGEP